jgi:hypothetical protein
MRKPAHATIALALNISTTRFFDQRLSRVSGEIALNLGTSTQSSPLASTSGKVS